MHGCGSKPPEVRHQAAGQTRDGCPIKAITWFHITAPLLSTYLTLAETFGWQPSGSINANDIDHPTVDYDEHFKPTYDLDEWAYCKAVSKEDAKNIAIALLKANDAIKSGKVAFLPKTKSTIFKNSLSEEEFQSINQ
jgi:hypothetical protein